MFGEIEMEETGIPAVRVCDCGCWGLVTVCVFVCVRETWIKIRERSPTATKWRYSHSLCYTPVGIYMGMNNLSAIDVWSVNWNRLTVLCICYSRICFMGPSYDCQITEVCILINWQRTETGILCMQYTRKLLFVDMFAFMLPSKWQAHYLGPCIYGVYIIWVYSICRTHYFGIGVASYKHWSMVACISLIK